jgi:hypothetical protein
MNRPTIVCLCGSTRFSEAFQQANFKETLAGRIVLTVGCMTQSDEQLAHLITPEIKTNLDLLYLEKVRLADEVFILNVEGYVGASTFNEFLFAYELKKVIRFLEPNNVPQKCLDVLSGKPSARKVVFMPKMPTQQYSEQIIIDQVEDLMVDITRIPNRSPALNIVIGVLATLSGLLRAKNLPGLRNLSEVCSRELNAMR